LRSATVAAYAMDIVNLASLLDLTTTETWPSGAEGCSLCSEDMVGNDVTGVENWRSQGEAVPLRP